MLWKNEATFLCGRPWRWVENTVKHQDSDRLFLSVSTERSFAAGVYGSAHECVPQEVSVISTLNAGDDYFLWYH